MLYNFNGKQIKINDAEIEHFMKDYELSEADAIKLWLEDNDYLENETIEEMTKKAKQTRHYEKSDKERKKTTRERKVDENKDKLLSILCKSLENSVNITERKNEAEFTFEFEGDLYTVKLVKHRQKKAG